MNHDCNGDLFARHGSMWMRCLMDGALVELSVAEPAMCPNCGRPWRPLGRRRRWDPDASDDVAVIIDLPHYKALAVKLEAELAAERAKNANAVRLADAVCSHIDVLAASLIGPPPRALVVELDTGEREITAAATAYRASRTQPAAPQPVVPDVVRDRAARAEAYEGCAVWCACVENHNADCDCGYMEFMDETERAALRWFHDAVLWISTDMAYDMAGGWYAIAELYSAPEYAPLREGTKSLADAIVQYKPAMKEEGMGQSSDGAVGLALWASLRMKWSDINVRETTPARVRKDVDAERGKRICTPGLGRIVQITKDRNADGVPPTFSGLLLASDELIHFIAVGSTGTLVEKNSARFCGVVTGRFDYQNSMGGTGHAIEVVGMFDLPENTGAKK